MTQPSAFSVMRNRAAVAEELRRLLPEEEDFRAAGPFPSALPPSTATCPRAGSPTAPCMRSCRRQARRRQRSDSSWRCLFAYRALHFFPSLLWGGGVGVGEDWRTGLRACPTSRPPSLPSPTRGEGKGTILLVLPTYGLRDYGRPHGHGLNALGLDPRRLILAETAHRKDTLWAMEEALHSRSVAAVAGFIDQLDLKTSQRLQLAATDCGLPLFLLRPAPSLPSPACRGGWEREARRRRAGASERRPPRATASA